MLRLDPDLKTGVLPISAAASQLARRIDQAQRTQRPIIVTQKGSPTAVLLSIEVFAELQALAQRAEG